MKRRGFFLIISILAILSSGLIAKAQTADEIKEKINSIKKDAHFIYGEGSGKSDEISYQNALMDFVIYANEIRAKKGMGEVSSDKVGQIVKELHYSRNDRTVTFVYLAETDLLHINGNSEVDATTSSAKLVSEAVDHRQDQQSSQRTISNPVSDDMIKSLSIQDNWIEVKGLLTTYKQNGRISETGRCLSAAEVPEYAYSFLIDEMYGILAYLSPKNENNRINYRTNKPDSETNYPNCKVIVWYK